MSTRLVHYYFGSNENLLVRALERFTERMIARQRELYASDVPFVEKWRTAMRYLVSDDVTYEKVWLELQAMAWNDEGLRERLARVNADWRAVLTDAFREPHRELGIEMPLEALVSLVITFNVGMIVERLGGIETGHAELRTGSTGGCRADRRAARAVARPLSGRRRVRRAGRGARLLRGLRLGRADDPAAPDVVDHPLAPVEGADPLSGPSTIAWSPTTGAATGAPTARPHLPGVRRARVRRRTRSPSSMRPRPTRRCYSATRSVRSAGLPGRDRPPRARPSAQSSSGRSYPGGGEPIPERVVPWEDELDTDEGWAKYNKHYWLRDYRGFVEFFFSLGCFRRAALDEADRGLCRLGAGDDSGNADCGAVRRHARTPRRRGSWHGERGARCSSCTVTGDRYRLARPAALALAEHTGGDLVLVEGSGHAPHARDPVVVQPDPSASSSDRCPVRQS